MLSSRNAAWWTVPRPIAVDEVWHQYKRIQAKNMPVFKQFIYSEIARSAENHAAPYLCIIARNGFILVQLCLKAAAG